jgi:hypothetical protein
MIWAGSKSWRSRTRRNGLPTTATTRWSNLPNCHLCARVVGLAGFVFRNIRGEPEFRVRANDQLRQTYHKLQVVSLLHCVFLNFSHPLPLFSTGSEIVVAKSPCHGDPLDSKQSCTVHSLSPTPHKSPPIADISIATTTHCTPPCLALRFLFLSIPLSLPISTRLRHERHLLPRDKPTRRSA